MLRTIRKLLGEKSNQIKFPIALMGADAVLSIVLYVVLYMTVIQLLGNTLTAGKIVIYTAICFISVIARLVIYRSAYYLCFARGAEMCGEMRLDLANHYRSLSLGYFNQNSSGYLLGTLTKDLTNFELVITHTLPSIVKTVVTAETGTCRMCCASNCHAGSLLGQPSCGKIRDTEKESHRKNDFDCLRVCQRNESF